MVADVSMAESFADTTIEDSMISTTQIDESLALNQLNESQSAFDAAAIEPLPIVAPELDQFIQKYAFELSEAQENTLTVESYMKTLLAYEQERIRKSGQLMRQWYLGKLNEVATRIEAL
jgi:hypothetical protein